ncbi:hypothetical protein E1263_06190 [Kribbella antibiotica]|uniref:Uncharacterized protein n=1 Tax=Kribbella antibiotica TaxID=190195 RepID=A0A4R4ZUV4_9ACTN|nr:hypothetical protein [Kribbella antibiotica]TDD61779.1 hypothetical protein E1263_06190 [Kribbella antibiotica]
MADAFFQGFGDQIRTQWGAVAGETRDHLVGSNQRLVAAGDELATGLRDRPMVAAANNIQYKLDDSQPNINHLNDQEGTAQWVGNTMLNAVESNASILGGVTGGMTA